MNNVFTILAMVFCHIVDDYYLQGCLASMKQKKWWQENTPQKLYKYDYIVALIMHSMSWSFMVIIRNIRLHANWIFDYDNLWEELAELDDEFFDYDLGCVDSIATALEKINKKDNTNLKFG